MQNEINGKYYYIEVICNNVRVLISLNGIKKVIAKKDIQQIKEKKDLVFYQGREFFAYSFSKLLKRQNSRNEDYAILVETEDIEAILYVEEVEIISIADGIFYEFPVYLKESGINYIINCHMSKNGILAFQIDLIELLKESYN